MDSELGKIITLLDDIDFLNEAKDLFSDYSMILESVCEEIYNPFIMSNYLKNKKRKLYLIFGKELEIFLQIKKYDKEYFDNIELFENIFSFEKYFIEKEEYFPRNTIYFNISPINHLDEVKDRIHQYRISNKITKKPLLTIAIPTYERSTFALSNMVHLIKSEYDLEIEIIFSDNNSNTLVEYYNIIKNSQDTRIHYSKNEVNNMCLNFLDLIELSNSKYMMYSTDTDSVDLSKIGYVLAIIRDMDIEYSQIVTNANAKRIEIDGNYVEKPIDCLKKLSLTSNLLTGIIFNIDLIKQHNIVEYIKDIFYENEFALYYPHMILDLFLESLGNTYVIKDAICSEYAHKTPYNFYVYESYPKIEDVDEFKDFENFYDKYYTVDSDKNKKDKKLLSGYNSNGENILRCYSMSSRARQLIGYLDTIKYIFYDNDKIYEFMLSYYKFYIKQNFLFILNIKTLYFKSSIEKSELLNRVNFYFKYTDENVQKFYSLLEKKNLFLDNIKSALDSEKKRIYVEVKDMIDKHFNGNN